MKNLFVSYIAPKTNEYGHCVLHYADHEKIRNIEDIREMRDSVFIALRDQLKATCAKHLVVLNWKWME